MSSRGIRIRITCGKPVKESKRLWLFGLEDTQSQFVVLCVRPRGHRGECEIHPNVPPPPLRLPEVTRAALWMRGHHIYEGVDCNPNA